MGLFDMQVGKPGCSFGDGTVCPTLTSGRASVSDIHTLCFAQNSRDELMFVNSDGAIAGSLSAEPGMKQTNYLIVKEDR